MLRVDGRDHHVVGYALAIAIAAIDRVPDHCDTPGSDRLDMERLLDAMLGSSAYIYVESAERLLDKVRSLETQ
jgi:hypothetical protein